MRTDAAVLCGFSPPHRTVTPHRITSQEHAKKKKNGGREREFLCRHRFFFFFFFYYRLNADTRHTADVSLPHSREKHKKQRTSYRGAAAIQAPRVGGGGDGEGGSPSKTSKTSQPQSHTLSTSCTANFTTNLSPPRKPLTLTSLRPQGARRVARLSVSPFIPRALASTWLGLQSWQKIWPHTRQWCRRRNMVNGLLHP